MATKHGLRRCESESLECYTGLMSLKTLYLNIASPIINFQKYAGGHNTIGENPDTMTDKEIYVKFQLLTNQRNLQKREVCRACYQTGQRGNFCGVNYYYAGGKAWDANIPAVGKEAEQGCVGCPWYDFAEWRRNLNLFLRTAKQENDLH